jgi:hypothetical protein
MVSLATISDLKHRAPLTSVWAALGGGRIVRGRAQGFWRNGSGYSISINSEKGVWFDHAAGTGGDCIRLVEVARGCSFRDAIAWLRSFCGMDTSEPGIRHYKPDTGWLSDLRAARFWKPAAEQVAEEWLDMLGSTDRDRGPLTSLLRALRAGELTLVNEYREARRRDPALTYAMVRAGERRHARLQRKLAQWVKGVRYIDVA